MKKIIKNLFFIILIFIIISGIFALLSPESFQAKDEISFGQLVQDINQNKVKEITVKGDAISLIYFVQEEEDKETFSLKEPGVTLNQALLDYGADEASIRAVDISIEEADEGVWGWLLPVAMIVPIFIFLLFFLMMFRQSKGGGGQTFKFLKAPAKQFGDGKTESEKITFKDIAGLKEAKEEIEEVVDFLKNPRKYFKMGARIPRGVLLVGPPGVGKTMLARAVANESGVPFFSIAGSAFIELFVGVGSSRARNLFETARKQSPSLVFIDELDAIGKMRTPGIGGGHEEREQTLNQILAEMDGFERDTGIIVLGATNKPEILDPALLRPGRFDRRIVLDLPDVRGREAILKIHCVGKPLGLDVKLTEVAERIPGFSGADIANMVNEAAILAAKRSKTTIAQDELLESIEKVLLGPERKSHLLSQEEKEISAFHEAGHALVSAMLPKAQEVRKVSIVSRGMAAGYTLALPKKEKRIKTKSEFEAELAVLLAGYTAEKLIFNELSTGASNDLEKASFLARALVTKYGMSKLGPVTFGKRESMPFLGWDEESERNFSEEVAKKIDKETERFIREAEALSTKISKQNRKLLDKIANTLIEKETIEKEEFDKIIRPRITVKLKQTSKKKAEKQ